MKKKPFNHLFKASVQIESVRTKNNVNWMNILRIAFQKDPEAAKKCFRKINAQDKKISSLASKLCN